MQIDQPTEQRKHSFKQLQPAVDFDGIAAAAIRNIRWLLPFLLPGGKIEGVEYVVRNPTRADERSGSFKINIRTGKWCDFATGDDGGDLTSLVAYLKNCSQGDAARHLADTIRVSLYKQNGANLDKHSRTNGSSAVKSPVTAGPRIFQYGDEGPPIRSDEVRRHVYRCAEFAMRIKIKFNNGNYANYYRMFADGVPNGWLAKKPDDYQPVPYITKQLIHSIQN
jgi:putative DNA primase/helicase